MTNFGIQTSIMEVCFHLLKIVIICLVKSFVMKTLAKSEEWVD